MGQLRIRFSEQIDTPAINPALSSSLKKTLPRIWGHQHQLDDQDKDHLDEQLTTQLGTQSAM